jgi:hypothetical protein
MSNHTFMLIYPFLEFIKLKVCGRRFDTCKIVLLIRFRDPPIIKLMTFNKGLQ